MNQKIGKRIFKEFKRPDPALMEKFRGLPSSNIGDMLNRLSNMRHQIQPFNDHELLGPAFTVKVPAGDNMFLHIALDLAKPGDIIVINGEGCLDRSLMGEIMITYAEKRGIGGFIVDGAIRDSDYAKRAKIPVYAAGVCPQGPYKNGPGEINTPIACGGQVVFPGDILVGDPDGIVVIRPEFAEELAPEAIKKHADEQKTLGNRDKDAASGEMVKKHWPGYEKQAQTMGVQFIDHV
jgi:regulator of RNase E activity RraA